MKISYTWEEISENMKYSPDSPNESRQATSNPFLRRTEKFSTEPEPEARHKQNRRRGQPAGRQRMAQRRGRLAGSVDDVAIDCCRDNAFYRLILARTRCFATLPGRGGGVQPPWRFQTKRRRALRKRPADSSCRVLAIGGIIFGPRSIFDPVMTKVKFSEILLFFIFTSPYHQNHLS